MNWRDRAACAGHPTEWWFPEKRGARTAVTRHAIDICRQCPVQLDCLRHAQEHLELHGIWGGCTEAQRLGLRQAHRVQIEHGTHRGYQAHMRYGQTPCPECVRAHSEYQGAMRRIRLRAQQRDEL